MIETGVELSSLPPADFSIAAATRCLGGLASYLRGPFSGTPWTSFLALTGAPQKRCAPSVSAQDPQNRVTHRLGHSRGPGYPTWYRVCLSDPAGFHNPASQP